MSLILQFCNTVKYMGNHKDELYDFEEMFKLFLIFNQSTNDHCLEGIENIIATIRWLLDNDLKTPLLTQCLVEVHLQNGK